MTRRPLDPLYWLLAQVGSRLHSNPQVANELTAAAAIMATSTSRGTSPPT